MDTIIPGSVLAWKFGGKPGNLNLRSQNQYSTNSGYNMLCRTNNQFLTYVEDSQPPGSIDLDFTTNAKLLKTHFRLPDGKEREIRTGERVALGIGGGDAFLYYAYRLLGINLKWSGDPEHQWRIYDESGKSGEIIQTNKWVAILNEEVEPDPDFLVHLDRPGANIGWTSSPTLKGTIKGLITSEAKNALKGGLL